MMLVEVIFQGNGYGRVFTRVEPTSLNRQGDDTIRLEKAALWQLAQLFVDVRGEEQPYLPPYCEPNLARWIARFGIDRFGEREFCRAAAELWVWRPGMDK
jgi:hypothetical protein